MADMVTDIGTSPVGLVRYVQIHEPTTYKYDDGKVSKPQVSITLIFDNKAQATPAYKAMVDQIEGVINKAFGKRRPDGFVHPLKKCEDNVNRDGDIKPGFDVPGGTWLKFSSQFNIGVLDPMGDVVTDKKAIETLFYPGCEGRVVYMLKPYKTGVSTHLLRVQKGKDGPRISGGGSIVPMAALDIGELDPMAD